VAKYYDAEVDSSLQELEVPESTRDLPEGNVEPVAGRETGSTGGFAWELKQDWDETTQRVREEIGMSTEEWDKKQMGSGYDDDPEAGDPHADFTSEDNKFLMPWLGSSIAENAISLQYAATSLFNSSLDRVDRVSKDFIVHEPMYTTFKDGSKEYRGTSVSNNAEAFKSPEAVAQAKQYLEDLYANTQRSFEERGITELKLYRGIQTKRQVPLKKGERVATKDLPLASWTAHPRQATMYGDVVVSRTFDIQDVIASCVEKLPVEEMEFIVHTPDVGVETTVEHLGIM